MCGVLGFYSLDGKRPLPLSEDVCAALTKKLSHRGPDDRGMILEKRLFFGHTRLAIQDLTVAGHQPMVSDDGRFAITYNGEIYNFRELSSQLEKEGKRFTSGSDTEVLLAMWQKYGAACLDHLDGIFAFAIFDRQEERLFLVRDHLGVKPLFWSERNGVVGFSSEAHAMFDGFWSPPDIDPADLDSFFTFNYLPAPRTGLDGVFQLLPGHILIADKNGVTRKRFWSPVYEEEVCPYNKKMRDEFVSLLDESVSRQLISDAPVGLFLSGGLDSFSIAQSASRHLNGPLISYTLGFNEKLYDESAEARLFGDTLGIDTRNVHFSWSEETIENTLSVMNELLADASCFPYHQLSMEARKEVTVAIAGDGGDELLAGYDTYKAALITPIIRKLPSPFHLAILMGASLLTTDNQRYGWRTVAERLIMASQEGRGRDHASFRRIFYSSIKECLYQPSFFAASAHADPIGEYATLMTQVPEGRSYLTASQHADLLFHLPAILAKVDRMSMATGLEVRVPLLRREMVEFTLNLPDNAKRRFGRGKRIMREALSPFAPEGSLARPKAGFLPPVDRWFRYPGPMRGVFQKHLDEARDKKIEWLDWKSVSDMWKAHMEGRVEVGYVLLGVLQFINWHKKIWGS